MTRLTESRKQRLLELEKQIREAAAQIQTNGLAIGRYLCEIRDEELWKEECESWGQYLHRQAEPLVGKSFVHAARLIQAAEVAKRLPDGLVDKTITPAHLIELSRLAPQIAKPAGPGTSKDYSALRKPAVARVLKHATTLAGGEVPTVLQLRQAVDHDLGIDRTAKAAETRDRKNQGVDLRSYIDGKIGVLEAIRETLNELPDDQWKLFRDENPQVVKRLTAAVKSLAAFCRDGRAGRVSGGPDTAAA